MITIINDLMKVERGQQYFKDSTGEVKICCMFKSLEIRDLKTGMMYYKNFDEEITCSIFKRIIKENNINTVAELVEFLAFRSNFKIDEFEVKKEFNPFIKVLDGELKIKAKGGHFNKAQVKKILHHKNTEVIIKAKYTDDYYFDAQNNYFKGVKVENIDALETVTRSFKSCCKEYDGEEFEIFVSGYSTIYTIKNNHITLL